MRLPFIAIVGRPNVGKSSLLNALTGKRISIVQDMPGVTRDRVSIPLQVDDKFVELVDTGGYGFHDETGLTEHIKQQIEIAMGRADLVLFIVDAQEGLTVADQEVAKLLRERGVKTVLIGNKADGEKSDLLLADFARLGLGTPVGVSALNGRNIQAIFEAIRQNVSLKNAPTSIPEPELYIAMVGKRNAGKSTLVNTIARLYEDDPQRVIVSEVAGTTRDSVDVRFEKDGKALVVIDTAGVRKKRHMVTNDIEFYSFHRAQRSVRRASVVMLLIDGTEPVSEPDKKLAQYVAEQYKPVVIVVNKWDLARKKAMEARKDENLRDDELMEEFGVYLAAELPWLNYAPVAFVTAKDGRNVQAALDLAQHLHKQNHERVSTGKLNRAIQTAMDEHMPSAPKGRRPKIFYATQIDVDPPTIVLMCNNPDYIDTAYQRFLVNRFRELLPYDEVPIKLHLRGRGEGGKSIEDVSAEEVDEADESTAPVRKRPPRPAPEKPKRIEAKPRPKKGARSGPKRGTRPK